MEIEKKLLVHISIYLAGINSDNKKCIKHCSACLAFQQTQPKE